LSVPFCGAPIATFPAATEPPVGSCCADAGKAAMASKSTAGSMRRVGRKESGATRSGMRTACIGVWLKFLFI
jgi:hypothetical protein